MFEFLVQDKVNHLHWKMIKVNLVILTSFAISLFWIDLLQGAEGSSQIVIGFFALSFIFASGLVALLIALQVSTWQVNCSQSVFEQWLFKFYRQVPMAFFSSLLITAFLQI